MTKLTISHTDVFNPHSSICDTCNKCTEKSEEIATSLKHAGRIWDVLF